MAKKKSPKKTNKFILLRLPFWVYVFIIFVFTLSYMVFRVIPNPESVLGESVNLAASTDATCASSGGSCVSSSRDCASGYTNSKLTCKTGICCIPASTKITKAPTNLVGSSPKCLTAGRESPLAYFNTRWAKTANATHYQVSWETRRGTTVKAYDSQARVANTSLSFSRSIHADVKFFWKVRGYNSKSRLYGPYSAFKEIKLNCK